MIQWLTGTGGRCRASAHYGKERMCEDMEPLNIQSGTPRDLEYISDPMRWVQLVCPLKRYDVNGRNMETSYLLPDLKPIIHLGNMWALRDGDPVKEYPSFSAIIDDGWRVD